jgi:hypothetical protein
MVEVVATPEILKTFKKFKKKENSKIIGKSLKSLRLILEITRSYLKGNGGGFEKISS